MLAVHFGAGNIGRGFIGKLLHESNYDVCFVDVNAEIVNLINERKQYDVVLAAENHVSETVTNVSAINSKDHPEEVINKIAEAQLVTTAIGPNILPFIADIIAKGLHKRASESKQPLNIIACENMIGGSEFLKEKVYEKLSEQEKTQFDTLFAFPNAAVDRIVPNQKNEDKLMVSVEPFYEWVVDQSVMVGETPDISGITFVDNLIAYIERKLFTVNTGHALAAYLGYVKGFETIKAAMDNSEIVDSVRNALEESGKVIVKKYEFDFEKHQAYIEKIIGRFQNPYISDEVTRVARSPLRKLRSNDRFISPATQFHKLFGELPVHLIKGIAAAYLYDYKEDAEAVKLQETIKEKGYKDAIIEISGLKAEDPLVELILNEIQTVR